MSTEALRAALAEPLPCPFCGSTEGSDEQGETYRWRLWRCGECGACGPETRCNICGSGNGGVKEAHKLALDEWNTRAAPPAALAQRADEPVATIEPSVEMVAAYLDANRAYWQRIDSEPGKIGKWRNGTPEEATAYSLRAALAATPAAPAYVPLSESDIRQALGISVDSPNTLVYMSIARAIESLVVARMRGDGK